MRGDTPRTFSAPKVIHVNLGVDHNALHVLRIELTKSAESRIFDALLRFSQSITSDANSSRKSHKNIRTSLGRNLLHENSLSKNLTDEN